MAYDPENPPALIAQGIGGTAGLRWFALMWVDPVADVLAPGYISNAEEIGMRAGDGLIYKDTNRGEWDHYDLIALEINADGSADLAFPEVPEEALPLETDFDPGDVSSYAVIYKNGRQVRVDMSGFGDALVEDRVPEILVDSLMVGDDYSTALGLAIDEADTIGAIITHRPGKTYYAAAAVSKTDKNVSIRWNGAKVLRAADAGDFTFLSLSYSFTSIVAVVAVTATTTVIGVGATTTQVSRIEVADGSTWTQGDIAKIVSDDPIPWSDPALNERLGETFEVAKVDGNYIYLSRLLRIAPSTDIRIAKLTKRVVDLDRCHVEDDDGSPTDRNSPAVRIQGAVAPVLRRPVGRNLLAEAFQLVSCYRAKTVDADGYDIRTSVSDSAYGYLIVEAAGCDSEHHGTSGSRMRHVITSRAADNVPAVSTDIWRYGGCLGQKIKAGHAVETGHSAWDFHEDAAFGEYFGCSVTNNFREPDGSLFAFKMRGKGHIIRDCTTTGPGAINQDGLDGGTDFLIENHLHIIPAGLTQVTAFLLQNDAMTYRGKTTLSARVIAPDYNNGAMFIGRNLDISIPEFQLDAKPTGTAFRAFEFQDSRVRIGTLRVDVRDCEIADFRLFELETTASDVHIERLIMVTGGVAWRIGDLNNVASTLTVGVLETDTLPNTFQGGFSNVPVGGEAWVREVILNGERLSDGIATITGNTNYTVTVMAADTQHLTGAITNDRTITEPTAGVYPGREITYVRAATATGAFSWLIGSDSLSAPSTFLVRKWDGAAWFTKAKGAI